MAKNKNCPVCDQPTLIKGSCTTCGWEKPKKEPKPRLTPEEKIIRDQQREREKEERRIAREAEREAKRAAKEAEKLANKKPERTEADIVRQYAKIIIDKQRTRGMISEKFSELKAQQTINKNLWQDQDFYFSVVFQSRAQKYEFLAFLYEKFGADWTDDGEGMIQIVNGLKLAAGLGLELKPEVAMDYPCGNLELRDFILDKERS